ncbi:GNAT family N-acetyltransferase [uncultured Gulosibacter sp.]|uniref:GNAT family N-acetyltransferase n=1 Tax=uncultured Gulosibacter sp. TaxID=1339167 RepID=UPI00288A9851|nr:GNAT family N-acetyltransferase [uncultured Gulosibacter sp.]
MELVTYTPDDVPMREELVSLYDSVGWTVYTRSPERLEAAIGASLRVVTARVGGELVGLARIVGDGLTIAYLQDILVRPSHHRRGIGRELFSRAFEPYAEVRQKVLMTDCGQATRSFYEAMGFTETRDLGDLSEQVRVFVHFS